jgi:Ni,Fe-hydrogenase III small subunit
VTGCIRNEENKLLALEMRKKVKTLIALGSCAAFGGIPSLANLSTTPDLLAKVYRDSKSTVAADPPTREIPALLDRVYAVTEVVKPDLVIPGCPPEPSMIAQALLALLEGKPFKLPDKSVCDECPTRREKKAVSALKRPLEPVEFRPLNETQCFMELGFLCLGPATRAGSLWRPWRAALHPVVHAVPRLLWPPARHRQPDGGHAVGAVLDWPRSEADSGSGGHVQPLRGRTGPAPAGAQAIKEQASWRRPSSFNPCRGSKGTAKSPSSSTSRATSPTRW